MPDIDAIRARLAAVEHDIEYLWERGREVEVTKMEKQYVADVAALLAALDAQAQGEDERATPGR